MVIRNNYGVFPDLRQQSLLGQGPGMQGMSGMGYSNDAAPVDDPWMGPAAPDTSYYDEPHAFERPSPISQFGSIGQPSIPTPSMGAPPSQVAAPAVNTYEPRSETDSLRRFTNAVNSVYSPDFTDRDRLRALMDAAPQREEPGFGRRLTAAAMGFRQKPEDTLKIQEEVMYAPHRRAMTDWTAKTEPFTKIAEIEGRQNVNERTLAGNMVNAVTQGDRIEAQRVRDEGKQAVAEKRAETDRIRGEAYRFKQMNPDWKFNFDGPEIIAVSPDGKRSARLGPTGHMTDFDKISLQNEGRVNAAREYGAAYWQDPSTVPPTVGSYNPRTPGGPVPPPGSRPMTGTGSRAEKEESPADYEKRQQIEWKEARLTDDQIKRNTVVKGNRIEMIEKPGEHTWFGTDEGDAARIKDWEEARDKLLKTKGVGPSSGVVESNTGNTRERQESAGTNRGVAAGVKPPDMLRRGGPPTAAVPPPPKEAGGVFDFSGASATAAQKKEDERRAAIKAARQSGKNIMTAGGPMRGDTSLPDLPDFNEGYTEPPTSPGVAENRRGTRPHTADINLPMAGTKENPARTHEELQAYEDLQNRAAEFVRRQRKPVTQEYIDFAIRKGWVK